MYVDDYAIICYVHVQIIIIRTRFPEYILLCRNLFWSNCYFVCYFNLLNIFHSMHDMCFGMYLHSDVIVRDSWGYVTIITLSILQRVRIRLLVEPCRNILSVSLHVLVRQMFTPRVLLAAICEFSELLNTELTTHYIDDIIIICENFLMFSTCY